MKAIVLSIIFISFGITAEPNNQPNQNLKELLKEQLKLCDGLKDSKKIQACKKNLMTLILSQKPEAPKKTQEELPCKEDKDDTNEILANFANVVGNFGKLVINPNDPTNVAQSLTSMIGGMLNIFSKATRNKFTNAKESERFFNSLDEETKKLLVQICIDEANKIRSN